MARWAVTKKDHQALSGYIRLIADEIGLRDWSFKLLDEPPDNPDWLADVNCQQGRRFAFIRVRSDFRDSDLSDVRSTICHELVHCHLAPLQHQCDNDLDGLLGRAAAEVFSGGYRRNLEYAVDAIAEALAPHLPLIEWP